jgi:hypothetical protein
MAAQTNIPHSDHVVHHVKPSLLKRDNDNQNVVYGCFPEAFKMRDDENELSASWLEHFSGNRRQQVQETANAMRACGLTLKPTSGLAIMNVGTIHSVSEQCDVKVRVLHEPSKNNPNPAYATIRQLPRDNIELLGLLASVACVEVVEIKNVVVSETK